MAMEVGIEEAAWEKHRHSFTSYVLGILLGRILGWVLGTQC